MIIYDSKILLYHYQLLLKFVCRFWFIPAQLSTLLSFLTQFEIVKNVTLEIVVII